MSSTAEPKKPATVTVTLTVAYEAKAGMTLKDLAAEGDKAQAMKAKLAEYGKVVGEITIGKQTYPV